VLQASIKELSEKVETLERRLNGGS